MTDMEASGRMYPANHHDWIYLTLVPPFAAVLVKDVPIICRGKLILKKKIKQNYFK